MIYVQIEVATKVHVRDFSTLARFVAAHDELYRGLIAKYIVTKPLTKAQLRNLPYDVRGRVEVAA